MVTVSYRHRGLSSYRSVSIDGELDEQLFVLPPDPGPLVTGSCISTPKRLASPPSQHVESAPVDCVVSVILRF